MNWFLPPHVYPSSNRNSAVCPPRSTTGFNFGSMPSTACIYTRTHPFPVHRLAKAILEPNPFQYKYPNSLKLQYPSCLHRLWRWNWVCPETSAYKYSSCLHRLWRRKWQSVPKRRHIFLLTPTMKMEVTECSETSAYKYSSCLHRLWRGSDRVSRNVGI